jgi:hypothetical protein
VDVGFNWNDDDRQFASLHRHLNAIERRILMSLSELSTDVATLQADVTALQTANAAVVQAVVDLGDEVASIIANEGDITEIDAAVQATIAQVTSITAADTAAATADPGAEPPTVSGVSPSTGSIAGGTEVTVTGTGFEGATSVNFGTTAAASFTVVSDDELTVLSPTLSAGTVDIVVVSAEGSSPVSTADEFTAS